MKYQKTKQAIFLKGTQRKMLDTLQANQNLQFMDLVDQNNNTALHYAVSLNYKLAIRQYLRLCKQNKQIWYKKFGENISQQSIGYKIKTWLNAQNIDGLTAMHYAAIKGYIEIADLLQNAGTRVDKTTKTGLNVFSLAARQNRIQSILYFKGKVDSNASDNKQCTALHWATFKGHETIVKYLTCQNQIQIDFKQQQGRTALHIATIYGHTKIVQILLMAGANRNIVDNNNKLAKDYAEQAVNYKIYEMLTLRQSKNCKTNYTYSPVKKQSISTIIFIFFLLLAIIGQNCYIIKQSQHFQYIYAQKDQQILNQNNSPFIYSYYFIFSPILFTILSAILALYIHYKNINIQHNQLSYISQNPQLSQNYCFYCKIITNQQISHCYLCNQCVSIKMRHNQYIGRCINGSNIIHYLCCIIFLSISIIIEIILGVSLLNQIITQPYQPSLQLQILKYIVMIVDFIITIPLYFCFYQMYTIIKYKRKRDTISALKKLSQSTFDNDTLFIDKFRDITINKSGNIRIKNKRMSQQ